MVIVDVGVVWFSDWQLDYLRGKELKCVCVLSVTWRKLV